MSKTNPPVMIDQDDIVAAASSLQNRASDPRANIWVNASAGTGKTKVLTDRVLRLLLPEADGTGNTPPQNILCITFTKAGAAEMITRVMGVLSQWSVCADQDLYVSLENLLGQNPSLKQVTAARQLFATVVDLPGGLNITTIHAFCQSILGRFTMESGLSPNFKLIEGAELDAMTSRIFREFIEDFLAQKLDLNIAEAFSFLVSEKNTQQIYEILASIFSTRHRLLEQGFDKNAVRDHLGLKNGDNEDHFFDLFFGEDGFPTAKICDLAAAFDQGASKNQEQASLLRSMCMSFDKRRTYLEPYMNIFFKSDDDPRKDSAVSKGAREANENALKIFIDEQNRLMTYRDRVAACRLNRSTGYLLDIARAVIDRYEEYKKRLNVIDYDDLIVLTKNLFSGSQRDWVLFKLDFKIDHILVDEAQDTSPEQWDIILTLADEFFSGYTHRNTNIARTLFVVGDTKQSIYSFQGADARVYNKVRDHLDDLINGAQASFHNIPMNTSFRSVFAVLSLVDRVFDTDEMRYALTQNSHDTVTHTVSRLDAYGRVELWPPYVPPKGDDPPPWALPTEVMETDDATSALADRIALTIKGWIADGRWLERHTRPVCAGDVMILVRRRNAMVEHLIRALKKHAVPVSGADRLVIADYIAVEDILAAMRFACLPQDDLALACLLKSPLVGWDDMRLESYAVNRGHMSLWEAIRNNADQHTVSWLSNLIHVMRGKRAFEAVDYLLNAPCLNAGLTGWQAFYARLGMDSIDPLDELLSYAIQYDRNEPDGGVQGFVTMMANNTSDIKREFESAENHVRIMTVHASKGLQAPIVICPDATSVPTYKLNSDKGFVFDGEGVPLWPTSSVEHCEIIQSYKAYESQKAYEEYCRLLYVAMTRAEDHLVLCGVLNKNQKQPSDESWYGLVRAAMVNSGAEEQPWGYDQTFLSDDHANLFVYESGKTFIADTVSKNKNKDEAIDMPPWATQQFEKENSSIQVLRPSTDFDDTAVAYSPLSRMDVAYRFRRGNLTHTLLQYLPDIDVQKRYNLGKLYLEKHASDVADDVRDEILSEVLSILSSDDFAPFFGSGSMAEVPVTGIVTHDNGKTDVISGQIDRLLVTDTDVWIVDFKSNRPPPTKPDQIPLAYRRQLSAYKRLMRDIYPNHQIRCALLWTDGPFMTELQDV